VDEFIFGRCALPSWASLYSLLHLNGFPGDTAFYNGACASASTILEFGAGDGRVGEALCQAAEVEDLGVELCEDFVAAARERLSSCARARAILGDMLQPGVAGDEPFDAVLMTANTMFCTPCHADLLARCQEALRPGGQLVFDIYNARDWHEKALHGPPEGFGGGEDASDGHPPQSDGWLRGAEEERESDVLVMAVDGDGREWTVCERDPEVDAQARTIRCTYDFEAATGERARYYVPNGKRAILGCSKTKLDFSGHNGNGAVGAIPTEYAFLCAASAHSNVRRAHPRPTPP
jgi:SAM-dependent methyltransferase